jgi:hypothetical protein
MRSSRCHITRLFVLPLVTARHLAGAFRLPTEPPLANGAAPTQEDRPLSNSYIASRPCPYAASLDQLHVRFLSILPRIQTHAEIHFRHLRCPGRRDDAVQEVIALAWKWFLRLVEQQKDVTEFVSALADFAVRHVRSGRRLCGQEKGNDCMSGAAQRRHGFRVQGLPLATSRSHESLYGDPHGQDQVDAFEQYLHDDTVTPPPDQAAFRIDFPVWLSQLGQRNRKIAEDMALGETTMDLFQVWGFFAISS